MIGGIKPLLRILNVQLNASEPFIWLVGEFRELLKFELKDKKREDQYKEIEREGKRERELVGWEIS